MDSTKFSLHRLGHLRRGLRAAVTMMIAVTALLLPARASADAVHYGYVWKRDADGRWEDRANWNCINPAGGTCTPAENRGYPNVAGDEAFFDAGIFTARHTVLVNNTDIRVAKIVFGVGPGFTIQPTNLGQIILNSGLPSAPAEIVMNDRSSRDPSTMTQLFVPFVNESPLVVTAGILTQILFATDIGPFDFGLTVRGGGDVTLSRPTTYTGPTIVESGHLLLDNPDLRPTVMSRELVIGQGGPALAQVFALRPHQLVGSINVTMNFGWLTASADTQITDVTLINRSKIFVQQSAGFVARNVTMNQGGVIVTGVARFVLNGDVTVGNQNADGFFGTLSLNNGMRRFTVGGSLDLAGRVIGTGGLIKDGPGTLFFRNDPTTGAADNNYAGDTRVVQGAVEVFATAVAVPRNLVLGHDNLPAQVILHQPGLSTSTNVSVGPLGTLVSQSVSEDIQGLTLAPGGHVVQDGPSNSTLRTSSLTMTGGDVDVRQGALAVTTILFATSDSSQAALIHGAGFVITPRINTGDGPQAIDLRMSTRLVNDLVFIDNFAMFTTRKDGPGVLELAAVNDWNDMTVANGTLRIGVPGAVPAGATLRLADSATPATLDINNSDVTLGGLSGGEGGRIPLGAHTLTIDQRPEVPFAIYSGTITGAGGKLVKRGNGRLTLGGSQPNTFTGLTTVAAGVLSLEKGVQKGTIVGPVAITGGTLSANAENQFADTVTVTVNAPGVFTVANGVSATIASLDGNGDVRLGTGTLILGTGASTVFSGAMTGATAPAGLPPEKYFRLIKVGLSTFTLTGAVNLGDQAVVDRGVLTLDTQMSGRGMIVRNGSSLAGTGQLASVSTLSATTGAAITPGHGDPGILHADSANITGAFLVIQVTGTTVGTGYDQLDLTGSLTLGAGARLLWQPKTTVPRGSAFIVVRLTGKAAVAGTFSGLPEGATFTVGGQSFRITYQGGDGNDVVVTAIDGPAAATTTALTTTTYYLSDGFTGPLFDEDVLVANPNDTPAPVTVTFTKDNGEQIVETHTVAAQSRLTVHVDQVPGLESARVSAEVHSDSALPLAVERAMFWDQTRYAGHALTAVEQPAQDWFFAEGRETSTFHTFVSLANPNGTPADVTLTFFREQDVPVQTRLTMAAASRVAVPTRDFPDLANRAFGFAVHATQPIFTERSMYFGTTLTRGTASMGVAAPSTQWYFADGATGDFFDTFLLVANPQSTAAHVTLTYLLDGGDTITTSKTIPANARQTLNVEATDSRLRSARFSTIVTSDAPIVAERSMYWLGAGHTSAGASEPGTKWALAEGRVGGAVQFSTALTLVNPQTTAATVTITLLREAGAPVIQAYTVPPMSRFKIDINNDVPGMQESQESRESQESSFGAVIEVTNEVPIVVERSMYWNANGVTFSGGTSALATRLR